MSSQDFFTLRLGLVGAGNVGWHLASELHAHGLEFAWVYSLSQSSAKGLATELECEDYHGDRLPARPVDLLMVAVPDVETMAICNQFAALGHYVVHTSGCSALPSTPRNTGGVFYPLQTFTKGYNVQLRGVMCLVEAPNELLRRLLVKLARLLGMNVFESGTVHRQWIHLLGVLSNNFVNHLLTLACTISEQERLHEHVQQVLGQCDYPFSPMQMLMPLLQQTLAKAIDMGPLEAQTGPARRGDLNTLAYQRQLLARAYPASLDVYDALTASISRQYAAKKCKSESM